MRYIFIVILVFCLNNQTFSQNAKPYAIWEDPASNDYYFVQMEASSGIKTNIQVIPGMTAFVAGRKTAFNSDSSFYHFVGLKGTTPHLFTIDVLSGSIKYDPVMQDNVVGLEYNCNDSTIYGLRFTGSAYDLVKVNHINGTSDPVSPALGISAYVAESFSLDRLNGLYNFVAIAGPGYFLQSYSIYSGNLIYNNPFPDNLTAHQYSCADTTLVALWENNNQYYLEKIDVSNGTHSTILTISGVTPGIATESSNVNQAGVFAYRGFDSLNTFSIVTIEISTGTTVSVIPTSDNAVGFRESICCLEDHSTVSINNIIDKTEIILFPNPAIDKIFIQTRNQIKNCLLYSADGRLLKTEKGNNLRELELNTNYLDAGLYIIRMNYNSGLFNTAKFIK